MSRIGKAPVTLPKGVEAKLDGSTFRAKGSKGELSLEIPEKVKLTIEGETITFDRATEERESRALHGTVRALVQNMVTGVSEGFKKSLEIVGVGYRAQLQGKRLVLNIGYCHTVEFDAPEGISFACPDQTHIDVEGIDKQLVGEIAANIRASRKPEPYKGKGIRYVGEYVRRKAGKAAK